jgi:hypothetical protein
VKNNLFVSKRVTPSTQGSMKDDLKLWKKFFLSYNGVTVMPDMFWTDNESLELYTDSAGGKDRCFGIYFQGQWTHELWYELSEPGPGNENLNQQLNLHTQVYVLL